MSKYAKYSTVDNDAWITSNFEKIVKKFGGKYVLIINKKIFPVTEDNIVEVETHLRKKYGASPIGLPVPRPEEFVHILSW